MKPIKFEEVNCTYAEDQPEYLPLPVYKSSGTEGEVISCWALNWRERFRVLVTGKMWWSAWTFHGTLQPQRPSVSKPEMR